jgi:hypothetical protein
MSVVFSGYFVILTDEIFSPHTLHSKGSLLMKYFLHHQPWNDRYEYQLTPDHFREEDTKMIEDINKQIDLLDILHFSNFLASNYYSKKQFPEQ